MDENSKDGKDENKEEALKKEVSKCRRIAKKKDREIEIIREERNKALQDKLEQVRTIRNLNDSLDLLKKINIDHEKALIKKDTHAISTKTNQTVRFEENAGTENFPGGEYVPLSEHCVEDGPEQYSDWEDESDDEEEESENETDMTQHDERSNDGNNPKSRKDREQRSRSEDYEKKKNEKRSKYEQQQQRELEQGREQEPQVDGLEIWNEHRLRSQYKPVCTFYIRGECKYTDEECRFRHEKENQYSRKSGSRSKDGSRDEKTGAERSQQKKDDADTESNRRRNNREYTEKLDKESYSQPVKRYNRMCRDFMKGECRWDHDTCYYLHEQRETRGEGKGNKEGGRYNNNEGTGSRDTYYEKDHRRKEDKYTKDRRDGRGRNQLSSFLGNGQRKIKRYVRN